MTRCCQCSLAVVALERAGRARLLVLPATGEIMASHGTGMKTAARSRGLKGFGHAEVQDLILILRVNL